MGATPSMIKWEYFACFVFCISDICDYKANKRLLGAKSSISQLGQNVLALLYHLYDRWHACLCIKQMHRNKRKPSIPLRFYNSVWMTFNNTFPHPKVLIRPDKAPNAIYRKGEEGNWSAVVSCILSASVQQHSEIMD